MAVVRDPRLLVRRVVGVDLADEGVLGSFRGKCLDSVARRRRVDSSRQTDEQEDRNRGDVPAPLELVARSDRLGGRVLKVRGTRREMRCHRPAEREGDEQDDARGDQDAAPTAIGEACETLEHP